MLLPPMWVQPRSTQEHAKLNLGARAPRTFTYSRPERTACPAPIFLIRPCGRGRHRLRTPFLAVSPRTHGLPASQDAGRCPAQSW
jgi:hypothetical protein